MPRWEDVDHTEAVPERVPRGCRPGGPSGQVTLARIAKDLGIAESWLRNWMKAAEVSDGKRPGLETRRRRSSCRSASVATGC